MPGSIFSWATPWFVREADRWTLDDARAIARRLSPALTNGDALLDLGGGTGRLGGLLAQATSCTVTVLDSSPAMIRHAARVAEVVPVLGDATAMPFAAGSFDAVIAIDALHHIADQVAAVREVSRVLRPGGAVFVAEPNPAALAVKVSRLVERAFGEPGSLLEPQAMVALFRRAGIEGETQAQRDTGYVFVGRRAGSSADREHGVA